VLIFDVRVDPKELSQDELWAAWEANAALAASSEPMPEKGRPRQGYPGPHISHWVLELALYLKEADFVPLNACLLLPASLHRLAAQTVGRLLAGTHGFFVLPEGYAHRLATLTITEGDHPFEPFLLLGLWYDLLSDLA
jgi:hypothetical protein